MAKIHCQVSEKHGKTTKSNRMINSDNFISQPLISITVPQNERQNLAHHEHYNMIIFKCS